MVNRMKKVTKKKFNSTTYKQRKAGKKEAVKAAAVKAAVAHSEKILLRITTYPRFPFKTTGVLMPSDQVVHKKEESLIKSFG